jgi:hypothetical protein
MKFPVYIPEQVKRYCKNTWIVDVMDSDDRECLHRLIHDPRMREVYSLLTNEIAKESDWSGFIDAAWSARMDFSPRREALNRARELTKKIAQVSRKLAVLLRQFDTIDLYPPSEFHSITELLRKTSFESSDANNMWLMMQKHIFGEIEIKEPTTMTVILPPKGDEPEFEISGTLNPGESISDPNSIIRYAWEKSPPFSALLDTLAQTALTYDPCEPSSMIASAISSQKTNTKTEYLRAFADLLITIHGFKITITMKKIIAKTATVVINHPDFDVSYDDVRKALEPLWSKTLEDSGKNSS